MENEDQQEVSQDIDYKTKYEEISSELEKIKSKQEELRAETRKAKQDKAAQIAAAQKAEQEKAQKDGEFEKLWQQAEDNRKQLEQELQNERNAYKQEKIQTNAMKLAVELADGDAVSAKLLAYFVQDKLGKIANENGNIDDSILSAVKHEFKNNKEFAPLLVGSKSTGGGAQGNTRSASSAVKEMTQKEIDSLSPVEKVRLLNEGVKVVPNK